MAITLLDMLQEAELLTKQQVDEALMNRVVYGGKIGTSLIELGLVDEVTLAKFLSRKLAVPYTSPNALLNIPPETISELPAGLARRYRAIPIKLDKQRLFLAMSDPADLRAIDEIGFITDHVIRPMIAPEVRLVQALGRYYDYEVSERYEQICERISRSATSEQDTIEITTEIDEDELEEAVIVEDDEWEKRVDHYSVDDISQALANASNREEVGDIVIDFLGREFTHAGLFVVRIGAVHGWKGCSHGECLEEFEEVSLSLEKASVIKTVIDGASPYLGGVPDMGVNRQLLTALGGEPPTAALLLPIFLAGKLINILYVDGGEKQLGERMNDLNRLLRKTTLAFEILIRKDKILMT